MVIRPDSRRQVSLHLCQPETAQIYKFLKGFRTATVGSDELLCRVALLLLHLRVHDGLCKSKRLQNRQRRFLAFIVQVHKKYIEFRYYDEAFKIFKSLCPDFQDYALDQIKKLAELQSKNGG